MSRIPDIEAIVVTYLNSCTSLTAIAGHANPVATELPDNTPLPRIRITLAGGAPAVRGWLHAPRLSVEAWAQTKPQAFDLLAEAAHLLETGLEGAQVGGGVVTNCTQETGVSWSPDPVSGTPRYLVGFVVHVHPNPQEENE